ncbi:hypothetical protein OSB04_028936 [Centaurea solstitialis]|uniref:TIR domain-containing protein n=1 Tax=Centaurea solstitialis TaxID=347529 RepID=A0AA38SGS9_9ASTR|nr:hypothetical protein OSB04_028936 [Centaurea solstitialis]
MASPSSSSGRIGGWTYDVFLSFRGKDTRNNFVDHLHTSLVQKGLRVFKDGDMLRRGRPISSELLKAIEESRCAVVVFSEHYADSCWCLDELGKIMECQDRIGQKVLPVFYHVDPSDVRGQKRDFATAFQQHEEKFKEEMDRVNKWRKALAAAASLSGWHISPVNGGESLFINKIVHEISSYIQPSRMENNLIGIESRINELNSLLGAEATHEVRMVGICGMGGIGKTTIAKALFRRISYRFDGSSFVKGVRENSKRDICTLQQQILKDVLGTHHESLIKDPEDGAEMIQTRFCNKKVLLVLDDVDDFKQLEFLAATHEWFGAGSRIIITTRNEHLLSYTNSKYKPCLLIKDHAIELFSRHAFGRNSPLEGYEELSNRVIRYTSGLPLALKVLGSFFRKREASVWESALNRLAKTPNVEIFETLKVSFDGLEASEKKIFLDIACFYKGHNEEHVTRVLDSFGFDPVIGISALIEKSLITVSNKRIHMHDVLQEMGMEIIRKCYPNSRLWQNEFHDFIKKNRNLEAIEAIVSAHVDEDMSDENTGFSADVFENMKNLRLLDICGGFTSCEPTTLPDELRWLRWDEYPFSCLSVANMRKLVGLIMIGGEIEHLLIGNKVMHYLKLIDLRDSFSFRTLPDFSWTPNIEKLILSNCCNLVKVHESVGYLRRLVYLDMNGCDNLKSLPSMIEMESLETLILSYCYSLEEFPKVSPCMVKLSSINLDGCENLKNIPNSICELKNLKTLHLYDCMKLQTLPEELGRMKKLEEIRLGFKDHIKA